MKLLPTMFAKSPTRTPTIMQMEAVECGAAALAIILAYYGYYISLEELRTACGVSRDGSKASNMLKAARQYGLVANGVQIDDLNDLNEITLPCILFWEFKHFVVLEKIVKNKVFINDPARGRLIITLEELDKAFTGIALIFQPDAHFQKRGDPFSLLQFARRWLSGTWNTLASIILASLALVIPGIIIPGFSKIFIDDILIRQQQGWLLPLLTGMTFFLFIQAITLWIRENQLLRLQLTLVLNSVTRVFWHILHLPVNFFTQRYAGDISERLAANDRITELLAGGLSSNIINLISMIFFALIMLLLSWSLALIGIVIAVVNAGLLYLTNRRMRDLSWRLLQENGYLVGFSMNGLLGIETIKAAAAENSFFQRWAGYHARTINSQQQVALISQILSLLPQLLTGLSQVIILALGTWLIIRGHLTVGTLIALQSLLLSFNAPLLGLIGFGTKLQRIRGDIARLEDITKYPQDERFLIPESTQKEFTEKLSGALTVQSVSFGYSQLDTPLLQDFNLHVAAGKSIAIVGVTGCGKSTLAKLIAGLYQPWSGEINIGGQPLNKILPTTLSQSVAFVDQDSYLFNGTLRDNLTLWNEQISDELIWSVLQELALIEIVQAKGGLSSTLSESGSEYSGGQRQRLEIARALIAQPNLLILDEATSALDAITESKVYQTLRQKPCTLFIIAHRLSAIRDCDDIVVVDKGKIVQQGSHQQLLQTSELYRQLIRFE